MNPFYPLFLDLRRKKTLVVGGGCVALRKIRGLIRCKAEVTVVAPETLAKIRSLETEGLVEVLSRPFEEGDVKGKTLVIAATNLEAVNRSVFEAATRRGVLCNVVDVPELCDFHVPAQITVGDLKVAVSTGGKSPAFAARVRNEIEGILSGRFAEAIRVLETLRDGLKEEAGLTVEDRREIMLRAVGSEHLNEYLTGKTDELNPEKLR